MNRVFVAMHDGVDEPEWFNNVEPFVLKALNEFNFDGEEVSVLLCDDTYMQELNKAYRQIDSTTDVLSFENDEEYEDEEGKWKCVGDIVISLDTLPVNAEYFNESRNDELKRLIASERNGPRRRTHRKRSCSSLRNACTSGKSFRKIKG